MAKKIITATEIQKLKGYDAKKSISANDLLDLTANFFMDNDISETFCLVPVRFVERENAPECGYLDFLDSSKWKKIETPSFWDYAEKEKQDIVSWREYEVLNGRPCLFVDEPYLNPAILTLKSIGGYRVERKSSKGFKWYNVYLV